MDKLPKKDQTKVRKWLTQAYDAAKGFNGSEPSEKKLVDLLSTFEKFVLRHGDGAQDPVLEGLVAHLAFPDDLGEMPVTVGGYLKVAGTFYDRLRDAVDGKDGADIYQVLEDAGAAVNKTGKVFVKTDEGGMEEASLEDPAKYSVRTEPRLANLIEYLRNDGVNKQPIYIDDLVITKGCVDEAMMREHPYNIVQIPRLDMEIAVCDQIGETTFVKKGTVGAEFWEHLSKEELKRREDVIFVDRRSDEKWWAEISDFLAGNAPETSKKIKVNVWNNKSPNLDIELVRKSLLAHYYATGDWLKTSEEPVGGGKAGDYVLEHGPYAGMIAVKYLDTLLRKGMRGLPKSSVPMLNKELSDQIGSNYVNRLDVEELDLELIKQSLLEHRLQTGKWLGVKDKDENDVEGQYLLEHGPYAGKIKVGELESRLVRCNKIKGLAEGTTIALLNEIVSNEHGLDYKNHLKGDGLDMATVEEILLQYYLDNEKDFLKGHYSEPGGAKGSLILRYGDDQEITVGTLDMRLRKCKIVGQTEKSSIADVNEKISAALELDYQNPFKQEPLDRELVKESLLAHYLATGRKLTNSRENDEGKAGSFVLEHGAYAGEISASALERDLERGHRGLPGGDSISSLYDEIFDEMKPEHTPG